MWEALNVCKTTGVSYVSGLYLVENLAREVRRAVYSEVPADGQEVPMQHLKTQA